MPIPKALPDGRLPPFLKDDPTQRNRVSPYRATPAELIKRYATSPHRIRILQGLLDYRAELRRVGLSDGYQWIDGSFVEERPSREPDDLDLVTVASLPPSVAQQDERLFDARETRKQFLCDSYFVDLRASSRTDAIADAIYYFGLFSHRRRTQQWKGLVQIDLITPDADASAREHIRTLAGATS